MLYPLAQRHWMHRIQAPVTYLYKVLTTTQPPYLYDLISVQRPRSTRSSFVVRYTLARPPTLSSKNNWSLLSLCFTLSLELAPFISSSTSFCYQFLHFRLTYSFTRHIFLFWFTILHCTSITPSLFNLRLKTYLFNKSNPP